MDTKTESNLNNIITILSLISISSVKKFAGKCPQIWSQLRSMNSSLRCSRTCHKIPGLYRRFCLSATHARWMPKLKSIDTQSYAALTSQSLRATIGRKTIELFSTMSLECQESYLTTGMLPYKHSSFFPCFRMLHNAAASPASRLRSAGSLAITSFLCKVVFVFNH